MQVQTQVYGSGKAPGLTALAQGRPAASTPSGGQPDRTCDLELDLHFPKVSIRRVQRGNAVRVYHSTLL